VGTIDCPTDQSDYVRSYRGDLLTALQCMFDTIVEVFRVELRRHLSCPFYPDGAVAVCMRQDIKLHAGVGWSKISDTFDPFLNAAESAGNPNLNHT
jgi:hypothetical protein